MGTLYVDTGGAATNSGSNDGAVLLSGAAATVVGSDVTLDGSPDLSGLITSGATQSAIYLNDASNANKKIFWITGVNDGTDTVTVDTAPTGVVSSAWTIGGRQTVVDTALSVCRAGDICIVNNSPAAVAGTVATFRLVGDSTSGFVKLIGKTGVRPVLNTTNTSPCVSSAVSYSWIENLEIDQDGATGTGITATGVGVVIKNVKISDAGTSGVSCTSGSIRIIGCEISGGAGTGIQITGNASGFALIGNYIHDNTTDGLLISGTNPHGVITNNIFDSNSGRGIAITGSTTASTLNQFVIMGNTIYGNGDSGLEVTDTDATINLMNNIFSQNGNAAGEYNVEWLAGTAETIGYHDYNLFYHSGGGGGANLSNLTATANELTSDPLLTNPASGDFTIPSTSPAKAAGFPGAFLGGSTGYRDLGAVERQEPASGNTARVIGG